ncbi:MAG: hypothetical protein QM755_19295 [Luteolibacter sp.]
MKTFLQAVAAICFLSFAASSQGGTGANVQCWAPGMTSPLTLDSYGQGVGVYCGRPYSYKIYGVAGTLSLGNQCDGAFPDPGDSQQRFRSGWWIGGLGGYCNSYSSVRLQVNWAQFYPKVLEVTGDRVGSTVGPVRLYGDTWETTKMFGYPETTVVFHLAGAGLSPIPNRNPNGFFYVVGEYLASAPTPTGKLTISQNSILLNTTTPVGFTISRSGSTTGQTPPFTGYNTAGEVVFLGS